jgi:hypothetical protein
MATAQQPPHGDQNHATAFTSERAAGKRGGGEGGDDAEDNHGLPCRQRLPQPVATKKTVRCEISATISGHNR